MPADIERGVIAAKVHSATMPDRKAPRQRRYDVDLVSDNAAQPTEGMRRFMSRAVVGDDARREDPTVRELEERIAGLTGKEAAVFLPSGTMCNLVAYFVLCDPSDEVILHETSHPVYSGYLGSLPGRPSIHLVPGRRGILSGSQIAAAMERDEPGKPRTGVLSLENTHNRGGGSIWRLDQIAEACSVARAHGVATHLDGARLLNAVAATGISAASYCADFDSVWIDLSKGLACPMGAVLAGDAAFVQSARRAKALHGGVIHKPGIAAAAGLYALRWHVDRLAEDNARAAELAEALNDVCGVTILHRPVKTNIVYFDISETGLSSSRLLARIAADGVRFQQISATTLRAVTHLDISGVHVQRATAAVRRALAGPTRKRRARPARKSSSG
jgi:threonine aldolase